MIRLIAILVVISTTIGCAYTPTITTQIDALKGKGVTPTGSYWLSPEQGIEEGLQYEEFARYAHKALKLRGFTQASSSTEAELTVFLSYATDKPQQHQYTYTTPIYGETRHGSVRVVKQTTTDEDGDKKVITRRVYEPDYGVIAHQTHLSTYTTWPMRLRLRGVVDDKEIWTTTAVSNNTNNDIRVVFPAMLYASIPYLAASTGQKISTRVPLSSESLLLFKQGD